MKKSYISILLAALVTITSCTLDADLKSAITTPSAWSTPNDAKAGMYGVLSQFRAAFMSGYMYWGEYRTGLWGPSPHGVTQIVRDQTYENKLPASHEYADWTALYTTINDANLVLKHVPSISFNDESDKRMILGNALYVRAFTYYWIARIWGDAPLLLNGYESEEDMYPSRAPKSDIFAQVASDLSEAEGLLKDLKIKPNYANINAVYTLETDLYLWLYKVEKDDSALAKARTACDAVLGKGKLLPSFKDVFNVENKNNDEEIFVISMVKDEKEGGAQADWLCPLQDVSASLCENPVKVGSHQQWSFITKDYQDLLTADASDVRGQATFDSKYDEAKKTTHMWMNKLTGSWIDKTRVFNSDYIFYRYADVLLFDAEISCYENRLAEAAASVSKIAERATGKADKYAASLGAEALLDAILTERTKEFCCEGRLWWDYIRMGVVFDKVPALKGKQNNKNILLWPVSNNALNGNQNIRQTEIEY